VERILKKRSYHFFTAISFATTLSLLVSTSSHGRIKKDAPLPMPIPMSPVGTIPESTNMAWCGDLLAWEVFHVDEDGEPIKADGIYKKDVFVGKLGTMNFAISPADPRSGMQCLTCENDTADNDLADSVYRGGVAWGPDCDWLTFTANNEHSDPDTPADVTSAWGMNFDLYAIDARDPLTVKIDRAVARLTTRGKMPADDDVSTTDIGTAILHPEIFDSYTSEKNGIKQTFIAFTDRDDPVTLRTLHRQSPWIGWYYRVHEIKYRPEGPTNPEGPTWQLGEGYVDGRTTATDDTTNETVLTPERRGLIEPAGIKQAGNSGRFYLYFTQTGCDLADHGHLNPDGRLPYNCGYAYQGDDHRMIFDSKTRTFGKKETLLSEPGIWTEKYRPVLDTADFSVARTISDDPEDPDYWNYLDARNYFNAYALVMKLEMELYIKRDDDLMRQTYYNDPAHLEWITEKIGAPPLKEDGTEDHWEHVVVSKYRWNEKNGYLALNYTISSPGGILHGETQQFVRIYQPACGNGVCDDFTKNPQEGLFSDYVETPKTCLADCRAIDLDPNIPPTEDQTPEPGPDTPPTNEQTPDPRPNTTPTDDQTSETSPEVLPADNPNNDNNQPGDQPSKACESSVSQQPDIGLIILILGLSCVICSQRKHWAHL